MEIIDIQKNMAEGGGTPRELADWRVVVAGAIGNRTTQLQKIQMEKPERWQQLRKNFKSVADTERAWDATEEGIQENWLKLEIKKLEKLSSALRTSLEVANLESRNMM